MTTTQLEAARLILSGYARVSRSGLLVARIDNKDWKERLAIDLRTVQGRIDTTGHAADQYRRCNSRDVLKVSRAVFDLMPSSSHYPVGYRDVVPPLT